MSAVSSRVTVESHDPGRIVVPTQIRPSHACRTSRAGVEFERRWSLYAPMTHRTKCSCGAVAIIWPATGSTGSSAPTMRATDPAHGPAAFTTRSDAKSPIVVRARQPAPSRSMSVTLAPRCTLTPARLAAATRARVMRGGSTWPSPSRYVAAKTASETAGSTDLQLAPIEEDGRFVRGELALFGDERATLGELLFVLEQDERAAPQIAAVVADALEQLRVIRDARESEREVRTGRSRLRGDPTAAASRCAVGDAVTLENADREPAPAKVQGDRRPDQPCTDDEDVRTRDCYHTASKTRMRLPPMTFLTSVSE